MNSVSHHPLYLDQDRNTPLHLAARDPKKIESLNILFQQHTDQPMPKEFFYPNVWNDTPLHLVAGDIAATDFLLKKYPKEQLRLSLLPNANGQTPLHLAAILTIAYKTKSYAVGQILKIVDEFPDMRAIVFEKNKFGDTPLHPAHDDPEAYIALLEACPKRGLELALEPNQNKFHFLTLAIQRGDSQAVERFARRWQEVI